MVNRDAREGIRGFLIPVLLVAVVLLAVLSGCLGVFEEGEKSPEEVQQEFVDRYRGMFDFHVEVSGGGSGESGAVAFDGQELRYKNESYQATGVYYELARYGYFQGEVDSGDVISRTHYRANWGSGKLHVKIGNETQTLEGVERDDWDTVHDVNMSNRSKWSYVSAQDEVGEIIRSKVTGGGSKTANLDPENDLVAELLNEQFEAPMGKQVLNFTGKDIKEADVQLRRQGPLGPTYEIRIEGETVDGEDFSSSIFLK